MQCFVLECARKQDEFSTSVEQVKSWNLIIYSESKALLPAEVLCRCQRYFGLAKLIFVHEGSFQYET